MKKAPSPESALIFDWRRREHTSPWLIAFCLITLLGIASLFLVFRIITPEPPRLTARPQQMIVLNPNVPAERALIHRAVDRSFTLIPSEMPGTQDVPSMARLPGFTPRPFEMKLKAADSDLTARESPSLLKQDFLDVLPPLPSTDATRVKTAPASKLRAHIQSVNPRPLLSGSELADIALVDPTKPRFQVGIGPLGQVLIAVPVSSSEDPEIMVKLHAAMTQLRFQPQPDQKEPMEWAEVSFTWEKEAAP